MHVCSHLQDAVIVNKMMINADAMIILNKMTVKATKRKIAAHKILVKKQ
jgi:hypothetical protein